MGCCNNRRICAVYCNKTSGFEIAHGLLDRLMHVLEVDYGESRKPSGLAYRLEEIDGMFPKLRNAIQLPYVEIFVDFVLLLDSTYFPGRCADVVLLPEGKSIGRLGIVHPNVLRNFDLPFSVSSFEVDIEPFL